MSSKREARSMAKQAIALLRKAQAVLDGSSRSCDGCRREVFTNPVERRAGDAFQTAIGKVQRGLRVLDGE